MSSAGIGSPATMSHRTTQTTSSLPLVVTLNCIDDFAMKQDYLSGVASVEHVPLSRLADGRIESASAVLLQSLTEQMYPGSPARPATSGKRVKRTAGRKFIARKSPRLAATSASASIQAPNCKGPCGNHEAIY